MKMAIKAPGFRMFVKPNEVKQMSDGGIDLSALDQEAEKNAQTTGTVVAIGEDFAVAFKPKTPYWGIKVGDKVYYPRYAGKWLENKETKEEVLAINDEDVIGYESV